MSASSLDTLKTSISNFGNSLNSILDTKPSVSALSKVYNVRAATTVNIDLSVAKVGATIDDVVIAPGDWVLFLNQTNRLENGVRVYDGTFFKKYPDTLNAGSQYVSAEFLVDEGTVYGESKWLCTIDKNTANLGTAIFPFVNVYSRQVFNNNSVVSTGLSLPKFIGGLGNTFKDQIALTTLTNPDGTIGIQSLSLNQVRIAEVTSGAAPTVAGQYKLVSLDAFSFPNLMANSTMCLRGKVSGNSLIPYLCTTSALTKDPIPSSQVYSSGGSAGGFFSTPFDILLAVIITTDLKSAPTIIPIINNGESSGRAVTKITGDGSLFLPIDPFMIAGKLTVGNFSQVITGSPLPKIAFANSNWNWSCYVNFMPTASGFTSGYANKTSTPINITTEDNVGDYTLVTLSASFDYTSKLSLWQSYQVEHNVSDTTGALGDELLHGAGSYTLTNAGFVTGIPINFSKIANANIIWEWSR